MGVDQKTGKNAQDHRGGDQGWKESFQNRHPAIAKTYDSIGKSISPWVAQEAGSVLAWLAH
jgi:hypothetical protein